MIPLAKDTREAIGSFAEKVENRSLLFEKMVLSKSSLHEVDRFDDAQRFNVLRATHEGFEILQEEAQSARSYADRGGKNAEASRYKATVASALSSIRTDNPVLTESRIRSNNRFLLDLKKSYSGHSRTFVATLGGRLLINMAGGVMENSGIALDRLTGLPFIPGTSVKGIARHFALWQLRQTEDAQEQEQLLRTALAIFGFSPNDLTPKGDFLWALNGNRQVFEKVTQSFNTDTYKGLLSFLAAQPSSSENLRVVAEVLTPHFDNNPRPIFFPAVDAGSEFAFALILQRSPLHPDLDATQLLQQAQEWLLNALTQSGIGAKTGAGYGWFQIDPQAEEKRRAQLAAEEQALQNAREQAAQKAAADLAEQEAAAAAEARFNSMSPQEQAAESIRQLNDQDFAQFAKELADKDELAQRAFLSVLQSSDYKKKRKTWQKKKVELWSSVSAVASSLNIELS